MARFRVKSLKTGKWYDVCQHPFFVKRTDGKWQRLLPNKFKVYHGTKRYWLDIDCISENGDKNDDYGGTPDGRGENGTGEPVNGGSGGYDPNDPNNPNSGVVRDPVSGKIVDKNKTNPTNNVENINNASKSSPSFNDADLGSSPKGIGDNNSEAGTYRINEKYPSGYDLPDSGDINAGEVTKPDGTTCINRPGLGTCEANKTGNDRSSCSGAGTFDSPKPCPCTLFSEDYTIQEVYAEVGQVTGEVFFDYEIIGRASIDVYFAGVRQVTTNGKVSGVGRLSFPYDFALGNGETKLFIRVRKDDNTDWQLSWTCPEDEYVDDTGTLSNPAACHGTFEPKEGTRGISEYIHDMGSKAGEVVLKYQMWNIPDKIEVLYRGRVISSTQGFVSGEGILKFNYSPAGSVTTVTVRVVADAANTSWAYQIHCPDEKGSEINPKVCGPDEGIVHSGGAGVTDTYYAMGNAQGIVRVRYQMWNIADSLDVYQNGNLVASTNGPVAGEDKVEFLYKPSAGKSLMVRVIGQGKTSWSFLLECPEINTEISVGNVVLDEGNSGDKQACFPVTVSPVTDSEVSIDYNTVDISAKSSVGNSSILAEDSQGRPFIAIMEGSGGAGNVVYDGGFPKYYNSVFPVGAKSFNALTNQFKLLINAYYWTKSTSYKKVYAYGASTRLSSYSVKGIGTGGFKTSLTETFGVEGISVSIFDETDYAGRHITSADLQGYDFAAVFSVGDTLTANSAAALSAFVQSGGGMMIITDHDIYQPDGNKIMKAFNAEFYGKVDRSPIAVSAMISKYGKHPLWDNITGYLPAGASEGNVRLLAAQNDYRAKSGTLKIPPNTASSKICVPIIGDTLIENNETFKLVISNPKNAILKTNEAVGTITNDDVTPPPPPKPVVPCGQSTKSGGAGVTRTEHTVGSGSGKVKVTCNAYHVPDKFEIFYRGVLVATTGTEISGIVDLFFDHDGSDGVTTCEVVVTGSSGTNWDYMVHCPV